MKKSWVYALVLYLAVCAGCGPTESEAQKKAWADVTKSKEEFIIGSYKVGEKFEKRSFNGIELIQKNPNEYVIEPYWIFILTTPDGLVRTIGKVFVEYENQLEEFVETFEYKFGIKLQKDKDLFMYYGKDFTIAVQSIENSPILSITSIELVSKKMGEEKLNIAFGSYKVGEKFANQGFEGRELQSLNTVPFFYTSEYTHEKGKNFLEIWTTQDGTIAKISKVYIDYLVLALDGKQPDNIEDFTKIVGQKLNLNFGTQSQIITGDITIRTTLTKITSKLVNGKPYDEYFCPTIQVQSKFLLEQRKKDIQGLDAKKEEERIQQATDKFNL